ncbi:class I SAM-dependent methyltransferase [bacterium]|nr:class I SAM-dependent methyltransferase [bacterium]
MTDSTVDYPPCIVCGSKLRTPAFGKIRLPIVRCLSCGLVYRIVQQDEKTILDDYRELDYSTFTQDWMKARKHLSSVYVPHMDAYRSTNRILDVGAGHGFFLSACKDAGWNCYGVELSPQAVAFAREQYGLEINPSTLEDAHFPENYFDVVTFWNVLDQILDPARTLNEVYRVLRPGGAVFVRMPNSSFHINASKAFGKLAAIVPKFARLDQTVIHLYSFNKNTITRLLSNCGFTSIDVRGAALSWSMTHDARISFPKRIITPIVEKTAGILAVISGNTVQLNPSILTSAVKPAVTEKLSTFDAQL